MARLADLLDEDQFKEIEETISSAGVQPQAEAVPAWTTEQITAVAQPIAMAIAENCRTAPQLVFPHLFLGLKDLLTGTAPQQAEAVPSDVVRDAERYRWLRNESWAGYNTGKGTPSVYTVDGAGNRRMMLAEEAMDDAIDAAIAQQKGANHG